MMDIVRFLKDRLDEDEATARAILADDLSEGRWRWQLHGLNPYRTALVNDRGSVLLPAKHDDVFPSRSVAEHIARHDPARVLREVEAKRVALNWYENDDHVVMAATIYAMAAIYSDHPDYCDEWNRDTPTLNL